MECRLNDFFGPDLEASAQFPLGSQREFLLKIK